MQDFTITPTTVSPGQPLRISFVNPQRADKCYFRFKRTTDASFGDPAEAPCSGLDTPLVPQLPQGILLCLNCRRE
ncbi:hypothetical protein HYX00_02570 [Candidatus Woesearchaeota archaeon]|nr:hypothetical protein [Candidatus Woesearchaeota archaeon]